MGTRTPDERSYTQEGNRAYRGEGYAEESTDRGAASVGRAVREAIIKPFRLVLRLNTISAILYL